MRTGLVVVGVVLLVLGAVLMLVPLVPQASVTVTQSTPYVANITGFSITGTVPGEVSWSSSDTTTFAFGTCASLSASDRCTGANSSWVQNGTSGTITFSVATGGAIAALVIGNGSASVNIKLAETTIGVVVIVIGVLLLLLGVVLKRKAAPAPPVPSPTPATTNGLTTPPP